MDIDLDTPRGFTRLDGVHAVMDTSPEEFKANVKLTQARNYRQIHKLPEWRAHYPCAVIGGGPSLKGTLEELKQFTVTFAAGSVYNYLIDNGVIPKYCVITDASPIMNGYITRAHRDTMFIVATHCHPTTFDLLEKANVNIVVFNCGGPAEDNTEYFGPGQVIIGGGCTVGSRAIVLAAALGYTDLHLFGMDTCIQGDDHHAYSFVDPEKEKIDKILDIRLGDVTFKMAGYMVAQLFDFKDVLKQYENILYFTVHGEGALKTLLELGKQKVEKNGD
jgi:uncharacterized Rossmann fold enzyme